MTHLQPRSLLLNIHLLRWCGINHLCLRNIRLFFEVPSLIGTPLQSPRVTHRSSSGDQVAKRQGENSLLKKQTWPCCLSRLSSGKAGNRVEFVLQAKPTHHCSLKTHPSPNLRGFVLPSGHLGHPTQACHLQGVSSSESSLYTYLQGIRKPLSASFQTGKDYSGIHTGEKGMQE